MADSTGKDIAINEDERRRFGLVSKISSMVSMPYRSRHLTRITRRNGSLTVSIQTNTDEVASGIYPRKFEIFLLQMIASGDPSWDDESLTLYLGGSFRQFMRSIGSTIGGRQAKALRTQMERLWKSTISITDEGDPEYTRGVQFVVARTMSAYWGQQDDETLDQSWVQFSPEYIAMITRKVVPVDLDIVAKINSPLALDIYWWAARRLYAAVGSVVVTWSQLRNQFGSDAESIRKFKQLMKTGFKEVQKYWPELTIRYRDERVFLSAATHVVPTKAERLEERRMRKKAQTAAMEAQRKAAAEKRRRELLDAIADEDNGHAVRSHAPRMRTTVSHFIGSDRYDPQAAEEENHRLSILASLNTDIGNDMEASRS